MDWHEEFYKKHPRVDTLELGDHTGTRVDAMNHMSIQYATKSISYKEVHHICGEVGFTHYEHLINLHLLVGKGRFRLIGFPLKIRERSGSPARAIALFEREQARENIQNKPLIARSRSNGKYKPYRQPRSTLA